MNKKGQSLPLETIVKWIIIIVIMVILIAGLGKYIFPRFMDAIPRLFG